MSISFDYKTEYPISHDVRVDLERDMMQVNRNRKWLLTDPITFHPEIDSDGCLTGWSKLHKEIHRDLIDQSRDEDGNTDIRFILMTLCRWSKHFDIVWSLTVVGEDIGFIRDGIAESTVIEFLQGIEHIS